MIETCYVLRLGTVLVARRSLCALLAVVRFSKCKPLLRGLRLSITLLASKKILDGGEPKIGAWSSQFLPLRSKLRTFPKRNPNGVAKSASRERFCASLFFLYCVGTLRLYRRGVLPGTHFRTPPRGRYTHYFSKDTWYSMLKAVRVSLVNHELPQGR